MENDLITGVRFMGASSLIVVALIVAIANRGRVHSEVYSRSRWLVVAGCLLLGVHNLIQYVGHFREQSATLAWALNLLFYVPTVATFNLAERNLLRAGHGMRLPLVWAWSVVGVCYVLLVAGMATGTLINDVRPWLTLTCAVALCLFLGTAGMSVGLHRDMTKADACLAGHEQEARRKALHYTALSMKWLMCVSLVTPWIGMSSSLVLHGVAGFVVFALLLWYAARFLLFGHDMSEVIGVADDIYEASVKEASAAVAPQPAAAQAAAQPDIAGRVEQWVAARHYADPNVTIGAALGQMNVSATALNFYLEQHGEGGYRKWISHLRIEEAKRIMLRHPEYSLQAVAEECGYIHQPTLTRAFKQQTGMTPKEWQASAAK